MSRPKTSAKSLRHHQVGSCEQGNIIESRRKNRLVARDFKTKGGEPNLAAMLGRSERRKLMFIDVKKAHLNGKVPYGEFAFVKLPDGRIWRLKRWLYGVRRAAQAWAEEYASKVVGVGFCSWKVKFVRVSPT